jgi:crossover junction endodeoxyribonuclease RuvC
VKATLALDLGTNTGFAILRADGRIESGMERFNSKSGEGPGGRFLRFRRWLLDVKQANPELARVVYEDVTFIGVPGAAYAVQLYGGFLAIVLMFIEHHQLEAKGFGVGTIKKQFAGSGKAQKKDVIDTCKRMGFNPGTDNEADAIALLHVATGTAPLLTMSGASPKKKRPKPQPELAPGQVPF